MASPNLVDIQKLADLLNQLGQKLGVLSAAISTWQTAQAAMEAALADANGIVTQVNNGGFGITIPPFSVPVQVDPAWVKSILDSAAQVQAQGDLLKSATPP